MSIEIERWASVDEVAEHLNVKPDTVRTWAKTGYIPAKKIGKTWRFKLSEVDEWIATGQCDNNKK